MVSSEKQREYARQWYQKNKDREREKRKEYQRQWREANPELRMFWGARQRASEKNLPFDIEPEDIIVPILYPILNTPMPRGTSYAPSLDRIDPLKGYVKGNIQVISWKANVMKNDATKEELEAFAHWVLKQSTR